MHLSYLTIALSRNDKINPKTEKIQVNRTSKMSYSIEAAIWLGCERAIITINRPNHVKIPFLSDVEIDRESLGVLNILALIRKFSSEKVHVNWRFKTSCLKMYPIPRGTLFLLVLGITFALLCWTAHAVPKDRGGKRNAGNDKGGNEQHYSPIQAHKDR